MTDGATQPEYVRTRTELATALTALRLRAGLTVRELATRLNAPTATVGDYLSGRHLPNPTQLDLFRQLLAECGVTDTVAVQHWCTALTRARISSDGRAARRGPPYRGLAAFQPEDAGLFFGRETATRQVLDRLAAVRDDPAPSGGLLAVIGPSGSGKSSLLRAGLMPAVNAGGLDVGDTRWGCTIVVPRNDPATILAQELPRVSPMVIVVDQFEELFTATSEDARGRFLDQLSEVDTTRFLLVLGLRADFYPAAAREPALLPVLQHAHLLLGPMTEQEVRQAIVEPAHKVGAVVQDGLVEVLLADLAPRAVTGYAHDPGALPLLSHALLATWERASRNQLTVGDYRAVGGLRGAIQQTAEDLFSTLSPADQDIARRIFVRLVTVDEVAVTRRSTPRAELAEQPGAEDVLDRFIAQRLITADADAVQISHDALLSAWPRLRDWVDADRDGLRAHRQLIEATDSWQTNARDEMLLARGTRLAAVAEWSAVPEHAARLNQAERDFVAASQAHANRERLVARRRTRRLQQLVAGLVVAVLAAGTLSGIALHAEARATTAHIQALSREVALEAEKLRPADPGLAAQLALAAYRISPTVTARGTLIDSTNGEIPSRLLGPSGPTFVALSRDAHLLAVTHADDGGVHLYRLNGTTTAPLAVIPGPTPAAQMFTVAISPNGATLAVGGTDKHLALWAIGDPIHPRKLAVLTDVTSAIQDVAFAPDSKTVATVGDGAVHQYNIGDPTHPTAMVPLPVPGGGVTHGVAFSPDGRWLAADGANGSLALWPTGDGGVGPAATVKAGTSTLTGLTFNPASNLLVATSGDTLVRLYSVSAKGELKQAHDPLTGLNSVAYGPSFTADGGTLTVGSSDGTAHLWNTTTWANVATLPHPGPVTATAINAAAGILVTGDADGTARIWTTPPPTITNLPSNVYELAYTPDARTLLSVGGGSHGVAALWNVADPRHPVHESDIVLPAGFGAADGAGYMSADGKLAAIPDAQAQVQLVNISDPRHPQTVGAPLTGPSPLIEQLAFSPDGQLLAAGDDANHVHLWNIRDQAHPIATTAIEGPGSIVLFDQFSPDSKMLALASASNKVQLWNVADPAHPSRLATLDGFTNYATSLVFTPDGKTLAAGSADHTIRIWDVRDPARPKLIGGPTTACDDYVYFVSVTPDGRTLATACGNHTIGLWDIAKPAHPLQLAALTADASMYTSAFSPDGRTLAGSGADQTIHLWTYQPTQAAADVCAAAGDPITHAEWAQYLPGAAYSPPCR